MVTMPSSFERAASKLVLTGNHGSIRGSWPMAISGAEKCLEAQRLRTHPGVGSLTALAFVLIIGRAERFQCGKQIASYLGLLPSEESSGDRDGWDISARKVTRCCVSCRWRRRK